MSLSEIIEYIEESPRLIIALRILAVIIIGFPMLYALSSVLRRITRKRFSPQAGMLISKGITYGGTVLIILTVMNQLGFRLTALLGAAGVAGIAIGFAAQTSVSNIISGLFLISEKPFQVGDLIRVGETLGIVYSIDLLSIKLRKLDNLFIRIPNETIIKTEVTNVTRFPIRRMDLNIGVAYKEDICRVRNILTEIAKNNPYCLDEPEPLIVFKEFGNSALEFMFGLWFSKTDYLALRNSIMQDIKERFDDEDIEIPFPHRTMYSGSATDPFPIRIVGEKTPEELTGTEKKTAT